MLVLDDQYAPRNGLLIAGISGDVFDSVSVSLGKNATYLYFVCIDIQHGRWGTNIDVGQGQNQRLANRAFQLFCMLAFTAKMLFRLFLGQFEKLAHDLDETPDE
ncbi:unnamed protein product [Hydatigera taeniaeformis]|uniref:GOLD domain-containing protein n=1 Tax=Hydatigena taeniaeformis TaxID=6205 RepID=A0A0R3WP46_HYDTA|nr:unnamed protein product [Hydatigera taeniaeformis]